MMISLPDHYGQTIAAAMVTAAVEVILTYKYIPALVHQYADAWDRGLNYGQDSEGNFWGAVASRDGRTKPYLRNYRLLDNLPLT